MGKEICEICKVSNIVVEITTEICMKSWNINVYGPYEDRESKIRTFKTTEFKKEKGKSDTEKTVGFRS
jgi:hypothetical protein